VFGDGLGFVQLDESLSFAPPRESNQRKGGPTSLKTPRSGVIFPSTIRFAIHASNESLAHILCAQPEKSHRHSAAQRGRLVLHQRSDSARPLVK